MAYLYDDSRLTLSRCRLVFPAAVVLFLASASFSQEIPRGDKRLYVFDVEAYFDAHPGRPRAWQYDVLKLLASLQGLVNRPRPEGGAPDELLYLIYVRDRLSAPHANIDRYWLEKLRFPGELLADYRIIEATDLVSLLLEPDISEHYQKVVLWDERVPATANVAATICGVEGFLPVRYDRREDSLCAEIVDGGPQITIGRRLVDLFQGYGTLPGSSEPSTGSRKADAYRWAKIQFLDSGRCDPSELAYYLDGFDWDTTQPGYQCPDLVNACVLNHDYFISRQGFFFDLDPWWDEQATDERILVAARSREELLEMPEGADEIVLREILASAEQQLRGKGEMIRIGGFVPWWLKYTNYGGAGGKHSPIETERELFAIVSSYNAYLEPDGYPIAGLANASVFQHVQLNAPFEQNAVPPPGKLEKKIYVLFYMGDYESAAALAQAVPAIWDDASRGRLPLAWGINPTLADRIPQVFNYLFRTRTPNDYFVAGRSGAGRLNPDYLLGGNRRSGLDDGLDLWIKHNRSWYRRFDLQITGLIDHVSPRLPREIQEAFFHFSPHGVGTAGAFSEPLSRGLVPFSRHTADLSGVSTPVDDMVQVIRKHAPSGKPSFQIYRCRLTTPTNLYLAVQELHARFPGEYEIVDPYTFFYLLREREGGSNKLIAFFRDHTIPQVLAPKQVVWCKVRIRNDGWDVWNPEGTPPNRRHRLAYAWLFHSPEGKKEIPGGATTYIPGPVATGETVDVDLQVIAPPYPMLYTLRLYVDQEGIGPAANFEEINVVVREPSG